jgi:5-(carboxyamino)imidazole ribonucleotide synthase
MLRQAGEPLGIAVWPVGLEAEPEAVPFQQSVITAEIERWPETALTRELARHPPSLTATCSRSLPTV